MPHSTTLDAEIEFVAHASSLALRSAIADSGFLKL